MMDIVLNSVGKRYGMEWIFRKMDFQFHSGVSYALIGHNGSGKSTLLKLLSGGLTPSEGKIIYSHHQKELNQMEVAGKVSYVAPYIHLIEDYSLGEMIDFHFRFKKMHVNKEEFLEILGLQAHYNKIIKNFSSGMMQRLKLSLAILSRTDILLLDEPSAYLDENATKWYKKLLSDYTFDRLLIIGSNQEHEYDFVGDNTLFLPDYKYKK